ncbi:MAG: chorismate synthase, partial [Spirochaetales bacterium]
KCLEARGVSIVAYTMKAAGISCSVIRENEIEENPMRAPDNEAAKVMVKRMEELMAAGESAGGLVECRIRGVKAGLGDPVFEKLDACIARAVLSIGAVKGIEFGAGFSAADMTGSEHNRLGANHAGGILAGISTGEDIVFRLAVKPTPSVSVPQAAVDARGNPSVITIEGRHDPVICPRIVPVVEAMACLVLEDNYKLQAALLA